MSNEGIESPQDEAAHHVVDSGPTSSSVNVYGLVIGIFAIVLLSKVASFLTPYKLYFSFSAFLFDERAIFKWEALAIKLLLPCLIGFCLFYLPYRWMIWTRGSSVNYRRIFRYLSKEAHLTATVVGFFSALLMAWPFIVYWDILQRPDMLSLRFPFLCVYLLYFVSYAYFAGFGVSLARFALRKKLPQALVADSADRVAWAEAVRTSLLGIITSGIATYMASALSFAK
jgi:hypothetical protein